MMDPDVVWSPDTHVYVPESGGGSGLLQSATLILSNTDILNILATPKTLVTPAAGTAILPVAGWAVEDFSQGIYVDPDSNGDVQIIEQNSEGIWYGSIPISNADFSPSPGAVKFFSFSNGGNATGWSVSLNNAVTGSIQLLVGGPLIVQKVNVGGSNHEFTGGGTGNTLTIILYYIAVPTS
jgi:hypothetical protein